MTCQAISVGGGHWTVCTLPAGHPRSHLDRNPWQPINTQETTMPDLSVPLPGTARALAASMLHPCCSDPEPHDVCEPARLPLPVPNGPEETNQVTRAATRCLRTAQDLKAADAAVDQAEAHLRQAIDRQEAAAAAAHAAALDLVRTTSAKADRA